MNEQRLRELLNAVRSGETDIDQALARLRTMPIDDVGFARYDTHRALRRGFPEVIFGLGKSPAQIATLMARARSHHSVVLCTRVSEEVADDVAGRLAPDIVPTYDSLARCLHIGADEVPGRGIGTIAVVCAGTADLPVAAEAALTAELMGHEVDRIQDVGVAALHRVLAVRARLDEAHVIIVVAGMEGALVSVVTGLVARPVVAVPTSIGYGTHMQGVTALLGMLNACAPGVTVVNIDNGFGAGYAAALMNTAPT